MSDVRRAALGEPTDESADSTRVELAGAVVEVTRDDSDMEISVERVPADPTTAALSLDAFNAAAEGVRLRDDNGEVTRSRIVGDSVSLPGVERVSEHTRADTRDTEASLKAASGDADGRPSAIDRKREWMDSNFGGAE